MALESLFVWKNQILQRLLILDGECGMFTIAIFFFIFLLLLFSFFNPNALARAGSLSKAGIIPQLVENAIFLDPQWLSDIFASVVAVSQNEKVFKDGILNHKQSDLI